MKLYPPLLSAVILMTFSCAASAAEMNGALLFEQKCSSCHMKQRPHVDLIDTMAAPPVMGMMFHVTAAKTTKKEAVDFIVDYIFEPSRAKALCMSQSIDRFGLMPSLKGTLSHDEATRIAEYLYDFFGPEAGGKNN